MSDIKLRETPMHTYGELPAIGSAAADFDLTDTELKTVSLSAFKGNAVLLNVYPSIDTGVCFQSVKNFHQQMANQHDIAVLCISMDLPFALKRVAEGEAFKNIHLLSDFRHRDFGASYGLTIADGPLAGLLARAVIVLDSSHHVVYHELVEDIANPPNYELAVKAIDTI